MAFKQGDKVVLKCDPKYTGTIHSIVNTGDYKDPDPMANVIWKGHRDVIPYVMSALVLEQEFVVASNKEIVLEGLKSLIPNKL